MSTESDDLVKLARECGAFDEMWQGPYSEFAETTGNLVFTPETFENLASRIAAQKAAEVDAPNLSPLYSTRRDATRYRRLRENWVDCDELGLHGRLAVIDACVDRLLAAASPAEPGGKV